MVTSLAEPAVATGPYYEADGVRLLLGDCREVLRSLPANSVQTCICSPPYLGLRDYGSPPQIWLASESCCEHDFSLATEPRRVRKASEHRLDSKQRTNVGSYDWAESEDCEHDFSIPTHPRRVRKASDVEESPRQQTNVGSYRWRETEDCEHEWGDLVPGDNRGGSGTPTDKNNRGEGYGRAVPRGAFCRHCGAWLGSLGLEPTPELYVQHLVQIFREVRRVLRPDGTLWLNLGDSYATHASASTKHPHNFRSAEIAEREGIGTMDKPTARSIGLKEKDLIGIPWRAALALQADGWTLRMDVIWEKRNPMPESVEGWRWQQHRVKVEGGKRGREPQRIGSNPKKPQQDHNGKDFAPSVEWTDCPGCPKCAPNDGLVLRLGAGRPTRAHEYVFLLSKSGTYFYDSAAIAEPAINAGLTIRTNGNDGMDEGYDGNRTRDGFRRGVTVGATRNKRSVWTISTRGTPDAHFATFAPDLVRPMIMAGTSERGCCPHCGSPWARVVERRPAPPSDGLIHSGGSVVGEMRGQGQKAWGWRCDNPPQTTAWRPTCKCPPHEPIPCVVLDIFSGAGTTVIEAVALGRVGIGVDLKPDYHDIAIRRLQKPATAPRRLSSSPKPAQPPGNGHEPAFQQGSLI